MNTCGGTSVATGELLGPTAEGWNGASALDVGPPAVVLVPAPLVEVVLVEVVLADVVAEACSAGRRVLGAGSAAKAPLESTPRSTTWVGSATATLSSWARRNSMAW